MTNANRSLTPPIPASTTVGRRLRIGLLVDGTDCNKYVFEIARWAQQQSDIEISHLIVHAREPLPWRRKIFRSLSEGGIYRSVSNAFFKQLVRLESMILRRDGTHRDHLARFPLNSIVPNQLAITPIVSASGFVYRFCKADVDAVKNLNLDLLIRFGGGILRGDILDCTRLGVISFHHGDNRVNRGGPAGFWESYYRWDFTGFTIQKLTEELDGGIVLRRGAFATQLYYLRNQAHLCNKSNQHLATLLKSIAATGTLPAAQSSVPYSNILFRAPQLRHSVVYAGKLAYRVGARLMKRALGICERWSVSFVHTDWRSAVFWRARGIANPPGHFLADPFLIERDGRIYCFVEDYDFRAGKAQIAVYEISGQDAVSMGPCLSEPFHLSFPFLFHYQGELFMCPEACESREIRVYRCLSFPLQWELAATLMSDLSAADTMLFEHQDKWWMLTNIDRSQTDDHCAELYLFYADSPLTSQWTSHPMNPIHVDAGCGRNGGLIIEQERLFRVAQQQGFDRYGKAFSIREITTLTTTEYREQSVVTVEPRFKRGLKGTHHLSTIGTTTAIDHVTDTFWRS